MSTEMRQRDRDLIRKLDAYVRDATHIVRTLHEEWDEFEKYYQGVHDEKFLLDLELQRKNWAPVNFVLAHTETVVGLVGDSSPQLYVRAVGGAPEQAAEQLTLALQGLWYQGHCKSEYKQAVRNQQLLGTGFLKCWWNPDGGETVTRLDERDRVVQERRGEVQVEWLDPYSVYPDPAARRIEDCEYIALAHDVSEEKARRLWDVPGKVKFDPSRATQVESDTERPDTWWGRMYGWVQRTWVQRPSTSRKIYRVWEVYHDGGRRLTIYTGQQVLWDGDNPVPDGQFPVVAFRAHPRGHSIFGMPITSQIIGLQDQYNKAKMNVNSYLHLCAKPSWWTNAPNAATIFQDRMTPGKVYVLGGDSQVHTVELPPMPPWAFNVLALMREEIDAVTGVHDVTRGVKPGSVQSGIAIQQLQEAGQTRPRSMVQENTEQLEKLGQIMLNYILAYYVRDGEARGFAYQGPGGFVEGEVRPEMIGREVALGGMMGEDGGLGAPITYIEPWQYRVVVEGGQDLPMNAMAQFEIMDRAVQRRFEDGLPGVRRQDYLAAAKIPHASEIVQHFAQMQEGMMAAQQEGQQAQMEAAIQQLAAAVAQGQELTPEQQQFLSQLPPEIQQEILAMGQGQAPPQAPTEMTVV